MKFTDIQAFRIAGTQLNTHECEEWLKCIGAEKFELPSIDEVSDPETLVGMAGKRCYNSFVEGNNPNVTRVRNEWDEYLTNILKQGHGSVLEHASYTYAIENVTRVFTAEMNRHRAGVAISEASLRYIRFHDAATGGIPFWMPHSIREGNTQLESQHDPKYQGAELAFKQAETRRIFQNVLHTIQSHYDLLVKIWDIDNMVKPKMLPGIGEPEIGPDGKPVMVGDFDLKKKVTSMLRRIIPLGVSVGVIYTFNFRALRHVLTMRGSEHAEEEICYVASLLMKDVLSQNKHLFGDFEQNSAGFWVPKYKKV